MSTVGDITNTLGDVQYTGGYHEYTRGYHDKCGGRSLGKQLNLYGNPPHCTHDIPPHSSWYHPAVLMVSPTVLNTPSVLSVLNVLSVPPVY